MFYDRPTFGRHDLSIRRLQSLEFSDSPIQYQALGLLELDSRNAVNCFPNTEDVMGSKPSSFRHTEVVSPDVIRVVHFNGQLDEFPAPISVRRAVQNHPHHFICLPRDLYTVNCRPLQLQEHLQLGELYFLLPLSTLESDLTVENLMTLTAKLYAAARKEVCRRTQRRMSSDSVWNLGSDGGCSMPEKLLRSCDDPELKMILREHLVTKSRLWRPGLHTIEEAGFAC